jgi:capsular polysaccharide biosynthesis protein
VNEIVQEAERNGIAVNPAGLSIAADNRRSVGQLTMSYPDSANLQSIADAAIDVLQTRAQSYFPQLGGQPAQVTVLDVPTTINAAPPPLTNRLVPLIRIGVGLLAGIGLAFLAEYLDPTLRRREQLEALGVPVIATLPRD